MKTIKAKLIAIFMIIMVSLVLSGIILSSIGLKSYYIYRDKMIFQSISKKIVDEYNIDKESGFEYISNVESIENISITIVDEKFNIEYNSSLLKKDNAQKVLPKEMRDFILKNKNKISKNYLYYTDEKNDEDKSKLIFISQMSNGELIILRKPIRSINRSISITNQFYMLADVSVIIIGTIIIFIFSKKITKPIIEMSNIAENISNLEFDKHVSVKSKDEIGKLGDSINKISEKLSESIEDLKEDVERRKQLVRNMSHELKTPIGIIKGYAEGLKYGVADNKEMVDKYVTVLVEECDRMDKLIHELLSHSAIEAGIIKPNLTNFDVYEFISKIVERFKISLNDKEIIFNLKCVRNYSISADRDMIEKAINNYITNAIDHVEGRNLIELNVEKKDNGIKISVFNTGSYISQEDFKRIWDVYYKVKTEKSRKYGGNGMGLAIVRSIVQVHGGSAWGENLRDGVIFFLEIPNNELGNN